MGLSALAGLFAPIVFIVAIGMRKGLRRAKFHARGWNKRFQHELSRWT